MHVLMQEETCIFLFLYTTEEGEYIAFETSFMSIKPLIIYILTNNFYLKYKFYIYLMKDILKEMQRLF